MRGKRQTTTAATTERNKSARKAVITSTLPQPSTRAGDLRRAQARSAGAQSAQIWQLVRYNRLMREVHAVVYTGVRYKSSEREVQAAQRARYKDFRTEGHVTDARMGRGTSRLTKLGEVQACSTGEVQAVREVQACSTGEVQAKSADPSCDAPAQRVRYKRLSPPEKWLYLTRCAQNGLYLTPHSPPSLPVCLLGNGFFRRFFQVSRIKCSLLTRRLRQQS